MITGIIMASGFSRRFNGNKLLTLFKNEPLFTHIINAAKKSQLDKLIVITQYSEITSYCEKNDILVVFNKHAEKGQSSSVRLGVTESHADSHLMFLPADQPVLSSEIIDVLIKSSNENPDNIIIPTVNDQPRAPNIFPPSLRDDLMNISGEKGGRHIIRANKNIVTKVEMQNKAAFFDIDTPEDFEMLSKL